METPSDFLSATDIVVSVICQVNGSFPMNGSNFTYMHVMTYIIVKLDWLKLQLY